jgi:hypothetical protein
VKLLVEFGAKNLSKAAMEQLMLTQSGVKGLIALFLAKKGKNDEYIFDDPRFLATSLPYLGAPLLEIVSWQKSLFEQRYRAIRDQGFSCFTSTSPLADMSPSAYLLSDVMTLFVNAGRVEDVKVLLKRGAHVDQFDSTGQGPLHTTTSKQVCSPLFSLCLLTFFGLPAVLLVGTGNRDDEVLA